MDVSALLLTLVLGLLAGVVVGVLLTRWVHRTRTAPETTALSTERDLLRARVADLEERVSTGHALTSTVTPVTASLQRVEAQVAALERDRVAQYARLSEQLTAVAAGTDALHDQTATLAGARCGPRAHAVPGARCSCAGSSSTPGCWTASTSPSRPR